LGRKEGRRDKKKKKKETKKKKTRKVIGDRAKHPRFEEETRRRGVLFVLWVGTQ